MITQKTLFIALMYLFQCHDFYSHFPFSNNYLEAKERLFAPVTLFLHLFLCAGYFFNAFD